MEVKVRMPMHAIIRHPHEPSSLLTTQCIKKFTLRDSCANQTVEDITFSRKQCMSNLRSRSLVHFDEPRETVL